MTEPIKNPIEVLPPQDFDSFMSPVVQEADITHVSKQIFNGLDIDLKSQVTDTEVKLLTKIKFLEARFGLENTKQLADSFLRMRVSLNRQSRREFVEVANGERKAKEGGWLARFMGQGGTQ